MATANKPGDRPRHYSPAAVRRSLMHFLVGKGFAAVSTLLVLFILIRELSVADFAAYTSLHALTLIIGLLSSAGIPQALHRYLPELRTHHNNQAMYRLLLGGIAVRALLYVLVCGLLMLVLQPLADAFKLEDFLALVPLYFVVGFLRVNATFIAQSLESLLWQRDAQYSLALGALVKLGLVLLALGEGQLSLAQFVWIEIIAEASSMAMLAAFIVHRWSSDADRGHGEAGIISAERGRYARFAYWCYLQNLTSVLYGSAPNRLFVAYFMAPEFIAIFGVVDRLIDFARRYEPLHMFVGLVRPVLMSRFSETGDFGRLVRLGNLVLFANFAILLAPLAVLLVVGQEFLTWVTDGRYGDIAFLVAGFYVVLLVTSVANLIDMLVKAVELNKIYMLSNLLLSGSLLLAIPLFAPLGLWAVALANLVGLLTSMWVVIRYLARHGYRFQLAGRQLSALLASTALATAAGAALSWLGAGTWAAAAAMIVAYPLSLYCLWPLSLAEGQTVQELLPARIRQYLPLRLAGS